MEVLFVCTGNICRSPMAEGLMVHMLAARSMGGFLVRSAGTVALDGRPAEPHAVAAVRELGVDIAAHRARSLDPAMAQQADLILVMEQSQADLIARVLPADRQVQRLRLLGTYVPGRESAEIDDPYGQPLDAYRSCADSIQQCLIALLKQIEQMSIAT